MPLRSRLAAQAAPCLAPGPAQLVDAQATTELQRVLSARGQLLVIGELAQAHGLEPIVLKGGVAALSGQEPVDLDDVDVLVARDQAELLGRLLDERGYRAVTAGSVAHLPPRFVPEAVAVEVHFAIQGLDQIAERRARARPCPGFPGLRQLSPPDHLWHLLVHGVVVSPSRRGCLRDLVLTRSAVQACSHEELGKIRDGAARHPHSGPLSAMLEWAWALDRGGAAIDRFKAEAAARCLLQSRFSWLARSRVLLPMSNTVFVMLGSRADREAEWAELVRRREWPSSWQFLAATERRWPWLGQTVRRLLRVGRLVVARLLARPVIARARRLAARSGRVAVS